MDELHSSKETQQARAWLAVCAVLNEVAPEWLYNNMSGLDAAVEAIKKLAAKATAPEPTEPRPFDLEAAKRGEPLVTRDGRKARFLAHIPEATDPESRLVVYVEGCQGAFGYGENGRMRGTMIYNEHLCDLFMAPKPKRTVWVNMVGGAPKMKIGVMNAWHFDDVNAALAHAASYRESKYARDYPLIAVAVPIEIEA